MFEDLTDTQIALLCAIEEHDPTNTSAERERDLKSLIAEGYVRRCESHRRSAFELTAKGVAFLSERGVGLNEA
jgi:DNA-binding MarR family transcriptional regulator